LVFHGSMETWPVHCDRLLASLCPFRDMHERASGGRLVPCHFCHARHREGSISKKLCEEWHSAKLALKDMRRILPPGRRFYNSGTTILPYSIDTPDMVRRLIWLRMKAAVVRRDGFSCQDCGACFGRTRRRVYDVDARRGRGGYAWECLEVHHIIPRSKGGSDHPGNLKTLCPPCHRRYTSELMVDAVEERRREREMLRVAKELPEERDDWDFRGE
jgi:5-methylcytosine-specific restriction endonuclease McrA